MLEALSIRYGGLLIPADECDYNSFRDMALLCPICRRSVYLAQGSNREAHNRKLKDGRSVAVKEAVNPMHFRHHPDVDRAVVEDCELRSSKITQVQRLAIASAAKNQRAKVLRSHMWRIIQTSLFMTEHEEFVSIFDNCFDTNSDPFLNQQIKNILIESIVQSARESRRLDTLDDSIITMFDAFRSDVARPAWIQPDDRQAADTVIGFIENKMQALIVCEAYRFLVQPRQIGILTSLLKNVMCREIGTLRSHPGADKYGKFTTIEGARLGCNCVPAQVDGELIREFFNKIIRSEKRTANEFANTMVSAVLHILMAIDWGYQFERLAKSN